MKISKLLGIRDKEMPKDVLIRSHAYLLRAGYIKQAANGIYSLMPPAKRMVNKIENIIREEMNAVDGQEVLFPVVMPREMWEESGRYQSIGEEMVRFKDRTGHDMLLGMTHEEAAVHMAKNTARSYEQLPFMIYQIQTKFRDEARSRGGLIRVREFTMKDGYSFHMTQADMKEYYQKLHEAYYRIFRRIGMKRVIDVASDTGMMGGKIAHEFMLLTPVGEDSLILCDSCDYKANMEVAVGELAVATNVSKPLTEVFTGECATIAEVANFLNTAENQTAKAVCYAVKGDSNQVVVAFIRGDLEINECKLQNFLKVEVAPADISSCGLVAGQIGPVGLSVNQGVKLTIVYDKSLEKETCLVAGANKEGYHYSGFCPARDLTGIVYTDVAKISENHTCRHCGGKLKLERGIEVGNIFQLESRYTSSMKMTVHDANGNEVTPVMACYGIGVGRALASVAEERADDKGLVWPVSIAPWHVALCPLRLDDDSVRKAAEEVYAELTKNGIETLFDDRNVSAGVKLTDSELMGMPIRVILSPKTLLNGEAEISIRSTEEKMMIPLNYLSGEIKSLLENLN